MDREIIMNRYSFTGERSYLCILCLTFTLIAISCGGVGGSSYGGGVEHSSLSISTNGRHLVQNNMPFLIVGDSPQSLIVNLSIAEAKMYFANRKANGFNTVWINLLCATYTAGRSDGSAYDGIIPFTTQNDLSAPNEAYFSRVDEMIRLAASHGLVVFLDPA
jgi:hypothetical protein